MKKNYVQLALNPFFYWSLISGIPISVTNEKLYTHTQGDPKQTEIFQQSWNCFLDDFWTIEKSQFVMAHPVVVVVSPGKEQNLKIKSHHIKKKDLEYLCNNNVSTHLSKSLPFYEFYFPIWWRKKNIIKQMKKTPNFKQKNIFYVKSFFIFNITSNPPATTHQADKWQLFLHATIL